MARYLYEVVLIPDDDGSGFVVSAPDMGGCITQGDTVEEAIEMAADALTTSIAALLKYNDPVPTPTFGHRAPKGGKVVAISFEADASYIIDAVSPAEAAEMLGVTRGRVSQMIKSGQLTASRGENATYVDRASIQERLTVSPKSGRPRKVAVA